MLLKEKFGDRSLPIWIGENEAIAIAVAIQGIKAKRPMTHDLIKTLLDSFQAKVLRVVIADLQEDTYFAKLVLESEGRLFSVDARPSDSIAIGLRAGTTIYVEEPVMEKNGVVLEGDNAAEEFQRRLRETKPEDFGRFTLT